MEQICAAAIGALVFRQDNSFIQLNEKPRKIIDAIRLRQSTAG